MSKILVTGGAGFIGSHTCLVLLESGYDLVVIDNYANSSPEALRRVVELVGPEAEDRLKFIQGDIRFNSDLERAFSLATNTGNGIDAVIHFAGLKAVGESIVEPLKYWDNNVCGSQNLLAMMRSYNCRTLVFSSSATIYGNAELSPIAESASILPINPYGFTKAAVEQMLSDVATSEVGWRIACLRYFNPAGAHHSGRIGEDPNGIPNNLFPIVNQVAVGKRDQVQVFGGDWPTPDGSGIRDYIHVMDLAEGHLAALNRMLAGGDQLLQLNLGSGQGNSVLDVIEAFARASGKSIPYVITQRRSGDVGITIADPSLAKRHLGWETKRDLYEICLDGWAWQRSNPAGYSSDKSP